MNKPVFYVDLCMAGAVSAGAYTSGVMDYLTEAMDNWESLRGQEGIPDHLVKIPVIGGASAGGMTGIVTASAINNPIAHLGNTYGILSMKDLRDIVSPTEKLKFHRITRTDLLLKKGIPVFVNKQLDQQKKVNLIDHHKMK